MYHVDPIGTAPLHHVEQTTDSHTNRTILQHTYVDTTMNEFPLQPFLGSLAADGIRLTLRDYERIHLALRTGGPWSVARLRDTLVALLAENVEQEDVIRRRLNETFLRDIDIAKDIAELNISQVLTDLRPLNLPQGQAPTATTVTQSAQKPIASSEPAHTPIGFSDYWNRWGSWLLILLIGVILSLYLFFSVQISPTSEPEPEVPVEILPTPINTSDSGYRQYDDFPVIIDIQYESIQYIPVWWRYAAAAILFLGGVIWYYRHIRRSSHIPLDPAANYDPDGPHHFPLGSIGGPLAPRLDNAILSELADSMGYFRSDESGHALNVAASIQMSMRSGGIPTLNFHKRQQVRSLLILEDASAEALTWNPLPRELAEGLVRYGVHVIYGRFYRTTSQFKTLDGVLHRLEDLEDDQHGFLLMVFTDGKSLYSSDSRFALEELSRWPMVAWLDLREPRSWDQTVQLPVQYNIPLYPATPDGVLQATRYFLTEQSTKVDYPQNGHTQNELSSLSVAGIEAYVEQMLGSALSWAQNCALLQPITPGLADGLRRVFHPHIPAEYMERLYALPGTSYSVAGLHFSNEVQRVLRHGFLARRSEAEQEDALRFILQEIEKAEPEEEESIAYLSWEVVRERTRFDLDVSASLERLAELAQTPMKEAIRASLEGFSFQEETDTQIPLRQRPSTPADWQRLERITERVDIPKAEAYPVSAQQWSTLGVLLFCFLFFAATGIWQRFVSDTYEQWALVTDPENRVANVYGSLEMEEDGEWRLLRTAQLHELSTEALTSFHSHRVMLRSNGIPVESNMQAEDVIEPRYNERAIVKLDNLEISVKCREPYAEIGLTVERCPSFVRSGRPFEAPYWRSKPGNQAPPNLAVSIGLEISEQDSSEHSQHVRDQLLAESSVDFIYRIHPVYNTVWQGDEIFEKIQNDLGPLLGQCQLTWWHTNGVGYKPEWIEKLCPSVDPTYLNRWNLYDNVELDMNDSGSVPNNPVPPEISVSDTDLPPGCVELITNGDFETMGTGWVVLNDTRPAEYDSSISYKGNRSMRLGNILLSNTSSTSEIEQTVNLPGYATSITLSVHYHPRYDSEPAQDMQRIDIYNALTTPPQFLERSLSVLRNDRAWILHQDDLTAYAGQQIKVRLGVDNDGEGGRTAMSVDNVSILACSESPASPTVMTGNVESLASIGALSLVTDATEQSPKTNGDVVTLLASHLDAPLGLTYSWSFGDGQTAEVSNSPIITHSYSTAGSFEAYVIVSNSDGSDTAVASETVYIDLPTSETLDPPAPITSVTIATNSSTETGSPINFIASHEPSSEAEVSLSWDFGDGTTMNDTSAIVSYTYEDPGAYVITALASNSSNENPVVDQLVIEITPACIAGLYIQVEGEAYAEEAVEFSAGIDKGSSVDFTWNFGDLDSGASNTTTGQDVTHTYSEPGTYLVSLEADNSCNSQQRAREVEIKETRITNLRIISNSPRDGDEEALTFVALVDSGAVDLYDWDFGDGESMRTEQDNVSYAYSRAGNYTVTVTAINEKVNPQETDQASASTEVTWTNREDLQTPNGNDSAAIPPQELFISMGCVGCHNLDVPQTNNERGPIGPNMANLHETAGNRVEGMSAEEYVYQSIIAPNDYVNEGYAAGVMPPNFADRMSEDEIRGVVTWLLNKTSSADVTPPQELFVSMGCSGCHNLDVPQTDTERGPIGPNMANLHETAGNRVEGMSAEEYLYQSIVAPYDYVNERYAAGVMPSNFADRMSEDELRSVVTWLLNPDRER